MRDIIESLLNVLYSGDKFDNDIPLLYDRLTSTELVPRILPNQIYSTLQAITRIISSIAEGNICDDEDYWYKFIRITEILSSKIFLFCFHNKDSSFNELLFSIACGFQKLYSYFKINVFAIQRAVEYSNFHGSDITSNGLCEFDPSKDEDFSKAINKEYVLVAHFKIIDNSLINDGFLYFVVNNTRIYPSKEIFDYDSTSTLFVPLLNIFMPIQTVSKVVYDLTPINIARLIQSWIPSLRRNQEEAYKSDLRHYLAKYFNKVVEEQGDSQVDIVVDDFIPIETKKSPNKSEYDRLDGQIIRHLKNYSCLIVVIFDVRKDDYFNEWREKYLKENRITILAK